VRTYIVKKIFSREVALFVFRIALVGPMIFVLMACAMVVANVLVYAARPLTAFIGLDNALLFALTWTILLMVAVILPLIYAAIVCRAFASKYDPSIDGRYLWIPLLNFVIISRSILKKSLAPKATDRSE
jgi:hypothetical protein